MTYRIDKVGVVGAGTMGGGIAAHLANIGIPVVLLDIVTPGLSAEEADDPRARNRLVNSLYQRMVKAKPANLARPDRGELITVGNTEDDFHLLADCDWVVEVIIERLEPKQALMARLQAVCKADCIVSSNTSGIPIHQIVENCDPDFKARFLGTHFFNPPRYLKLLEIIPTADTDPEVVEFMTAFGRDVLGKGVVVCKDTPNFIANRFISITGAYAAEYALEHEYTIAEIDNISGPLIGRPKTATFRLTDLVGIDIMAHVNRNLYPAIPDDPYREHLRGPLSTSLTEHMLENKWLGNKTDQGYYKKTYVDGQRQFWTLNPQTLEYESPEKVRYASVGAVRKIDDLGKRLNALMEHDDRAAEFVRQTMYFTLAYAAYITPKIAYNIVDVDNANKWGFAHEAGPFEIWDMLGVAETVTKIEAAGFEVASWVKEMLANGHEQFYTNGSYYDFTSSTYKLIDRDKRIVLAQELDEVSRNGSASLRDMGDGVLLLEFHSKMNAIDEDIFAMGRKALERLDQDFDALVIGNNGQDFSVGANLMMIGFAAMQGQWDQVEQFLYKGQKLLFDLRHAPKPVVTAPHQRVLGGGVEFTMAGWDTVADHETYLGLVEVGAGLIPAWGGCKETLRRKVNPVMRTKNADVLPVMEEVFTQIATAQVATSAWEARSLGYLRDTDTIVFNSDHRLARAKQRALQLVAAEAQPPEIEPIYAAGRDVYYAMLLALKSFVWANYATEYDFVVGQKLAYVLCGGDLSAPAWVDPWHFLDLEREAELSLAGEEKTRERVTHLLQTGKPLRN